MNETFFNESLMNLTIMNQPPKLTKPKLIKAIILSTMAGISLIANFATILAARKNCKKHKSHSAIHTLILHLALADLFVTIFCIAGEALWTYNVAWLWGNIACKIFKFLQMFSLYMSTFIMVLIGFDRFLAVRYPMKSLNTIKKCSTLILVIWISSSVLSIPQLIIFRVARGPFTEEFMQCVTYGFYTEAWQEQLYTTLTLIFMFILPLIAIIVTYVSTVITISHNETTFKTELTNYNYANQGIGNANRTRLMQRAKNKSLRISFVIIAAFIIWWTPYYTMMIVFIFTNPDNRLSEELQDNIFFFGMSNSLVNPLIYGAFHLWPKRNIRKNINRRNGTIMHQRSGTTHSSFLLSSRSSSNPLLRTHSKSTDANGCNDTNKINETTSKSINDESKNNNGHLTKSSDKTSLNYKINSNIHDIKKVLID